MAPAQYSELRWYEWLLVIIVWLMIPAGIGATFYTDHPGWMTITAIGLVLAAGSGAA